MKQHLNTLFVTTDGAYLRKDGQAVAVRIEKETRLRIPLHNLDGIVCFGRVRCSPPLMEACAQAGVTISLLSCYGGFRAAVVGFTAGNVLLRRTQYRKSDDDAACRAIAANMVAAKIANCRAVLLRGARESTQDESRLALESVSSRLACISTGESLVTWNRMSAWDSMCSRLASIASSPSLPSAAASSSPNRSGSIK